MEKTMNLEKIFNDELITEMARGDLKGAGKALIGKDWAKAAKIYIKNAKARDLTDNKIISGLGSTFRPKKGETTVTVGKTEDGTAITLTTDDVSAMKKAVKGAIGFVSKASQKKTAAAKKAAEKSEKDSAALKDEMKGKEKKSSIPEVELRKMGKKKKDFLGREVNEGSVLDEISKNINYMENSFRPEKIRIDKNEKIIKEALKDNNLKTALREMFANKTNKQINEILKK
jgi:hypothetical protein